VKFVTIIFEKVKTWRQPKKKVEQYMDVAVNTNIFFQGIED